MISKEDANRLKLFSVKKNEPVIPNNFIGSYALINKADETKIEITIVF